MINQLKSQFGATNLTAEMLLYYAYKQLRQTALYKPSIEKTVAPIFACQRSGTSVMLRVFFRDKDNYVYREGGPLSSSDPEGLRLDPLDLVAARIRSHRAPLVVLKPLVESQNVRKFLDAFPEARPIWLYRHFRDVAASNIREFGMANGIDDIRPIATGDQDNWRSENASPQTRSIVQRYFAEDMSVHDAAALFWFARNQLFYEQNLDSEPRVLLVSYRDFVTDPSSTMQRVYAHFERPYPGDNIVKEVHSQSLGRGSSVDISPDIVEVCEELLGRLDDTKNQQTVAGAVRN